MTKKKQTQAQKNAKRRQARLDRQYRQLITNYKNIYNSLQLGAILGANTPSPEKVLEQAGTRSGLVKPTSASIKALKKLQTTTGVLRQTYWATSEKAEGRERLKEKFEQSYERDQRYKKTRKKKKEPAKEKTIRELAEEQFAQDSKKTKTKQKTASESASQTPPVGGGGGYTAIDVVLEQLQDYVDRINTQRYMTNADVSVLACAEGLIDRINYVLNFENESQIAKMNKGAEEYFSQYKQVTYQELYSGAPNLSPLLFKQVSEQMSPDNKYFFEMDFKGNDFKNMDFYQ